MTEKHLNNLYCGSYSKNSKNKSSEAVFEISKNSDNINDDLVAYSDGLYSIDFVYGVDGRISQETTKSSSSSPIEKHGKIYYHLGNGFSPADTDENSETVETIFMDIWGNVVGASDELSKHDISERFTTYTWDA